GPEDAEVVGLALRQLVDRERAVGAARLGRLSGAAGAAASRRRDDLVALGSLAVPVPDEAADRGGLREDHGEGRGILPFGHLPGLDARRGVAGALYRQRVLARRDAPQREAPVGPALALGGFSVGPAQEHHPAGPASEAPRGRQRDLRAGHRLLLAVLH